MRRLLYSGSQHRDDGSRGSKGILLIYFPRSGKLNSRFLDRVSCSPRGEHNHNDLFICRSAMINYEHFTII